MSHVPLLLTVTTATRPVLASQHVGVRVFDTDLGKPIFWDGTDWVDIDGNPADAVVQNITVGFSAPSVQVDTTLGSPSMLLVLDVFTSDAAVTAEDVTVTITDLGTGSAVPVDDYAVGPWSVLIPAGTADSTTVAFPFPHVQGGTPTLATVDAQISGVAAGGPAAVGLVGDPNTVLLLEEAGN